MADEVNESLRVDMKVDVTNVYVLSGIEDLVKKQKEAKFGFSQMQDASKKMTDVIGKGVKKATDGLKGMAGGLGEISSSILDASGISLGMDSVVSSMQSGFESLKGSSEEYAGTMKSLDDAQGKLGESLAGAFAPAIELLVPVLVEVTDFLSSAADAFGEFLAGFLEDNGGGLTQFKDNMVQMVSEIDWAGLLESLSNLWASLEPFAESIATGLVDLWNNVLVPLGTWILGEGLPALLDIITGIVTNEKAMEILKGIALAVGAIAAAVLIYNAVMSIATAVTSAFSVVMTVLTSPVTLIIAAIAALIAVGVLLYQNWDTVKEKASEVWDAIKSKFADFAEWFEEKCWKPFKEGLKNLGNFFIGIWNGIVSTVEWAINGIIGGINGMLSAVNEVIKAGSKILSYLGIEVDFQIPELKKVSLGRIPELATGGIATRPLTALVGEAGREAILPLEQNTGWMDVLADRLAARMPAGGKGPVYLQVDGQTFARLELPYLNAERGRIGMNFGSVQ